jgi:segregation and condensation protein B
LKQETGMAELIRLYELEVPEDPVQTSDSRREALRIALALLFAASEPLDERSIAEQLPSGEPVGDVLSELRAQFADAGVHLVSIGDKWAFRTAPDLAWLFARHGETPRKLSRAGLETLAIIAYHQPVTRAEIEEIRGVALSKGTLDVLLETGWVRLRGRRRTPGRPLTYGTSETFLSHFGLEAIGDLPGLDELKGAGLLDGRLPPGFGVPVPVDDPALTEDEDPLDMPLFDELGGEPGPDASSGPAGEAPPG